MALTLFERTTRLPWKGMEFSPRPAGERDAAAPTSFFSTASRPSDIGR